MFKKILLFSVGILWVCFAIPVFGAAGAQQAAASQTENGYAFVIGNGSAAITGYSGPGGELNVPWTLGGVAVTEIRERAFAGNETITAVNLPDSIIKIGQAAFSGCTKLVNIRLPANLEALPDEVFRDCVMLGSILIPALVSSIGNNALNGCASLTYVYFEGTDRLSSIGTDAFQGTLWFAQQNAEFVIIGNGVLIKYNGSAKQVTLPWNAYYVADAFENNTVVEEVILAEWTKGILANAFRGCSSLKTVKFGEWVAAIGDHAFENCISLEAITLPETLTSIGSYAFAGCQNLRDFSLPQGLLMLQPGTLKDCKSLRSMVVPDSVTGIGSAAFENCWSLDFLQIGKNVEKIGDAAFAGCSGLSSLLLPDSVKEIGAGAFQNCGLRFISLPAGLRRVEAALFSGCFQLEQVALPDSLVFIDETAFPDPVPLLIIPDEAALSVREQLLRDSDPISPLALFDQKRELHYVYQPVQTELYELSRDAGSGTYTIMQSLRNDRRKIVIPSNFHGFLVSRIGTAAFQNQPLLESVVIGDSLEEIMDWAFSYCPKLKEVTIGKSVTLIGADAFSGDSSLEIAVIPPNVQTFGDRAFKDCPKLTIIGAAGSAAESFALANAIPFRAELTGLF